jgi:heptosyltransferase-3
LKFFLEKLFNLVVHHRWSLGGGDFDHSRIHRILVVRNDNVGDVLCSTPAIRALRAAFPRAYIAALVVGYAQDAITGNPDVDRVVLYEKAKHRPDRNRLVSLYKQLQVERDLKEKKFDLAVGLRSNFSWSEAWIVYFSGAPFRLGYDPGEGKNRKFAFFYNLRVASAPDQHEVKKALYLVERIGVQPAENAENKVTAVIPEEEKRRAESFLREHGIDPRELIGFHLSSRLRANRWSPENFTRLASRLIREEGKKVVLTWGPGDEGLAERVRSRVGDGVFLFRTPHFRRLGAIQQHCRVFVSPDGGAMHFSAAVGTPTVGLFGKTDPRHWAPWGDGHVALRRGREADQISVEDVYQALVKWIKE